MNLHRWLCLASICLALAFTAGCSSSATVEGSKTVGQELKDLDDAYQKGIINREEYEKQKQRILNR